MIVYQTDYTGDGRFIGAIEADPDPLTEGNFLIPAGAVTVAPPVAEAPAYAQWTGKKWDLVTPVDPEIEPDSPLPVPTEDDYRIAIQHHVDETAKARRYDNGVSLASYVSSTIPSWAAEAAAFVAWRDAVWAYAYAEMDRVLNAERPQPSVAELLAELPVIKWPEAA